jgi:tRNA threonylcarbamoyladenosine modification (KEOPS) complex  Pcc1 subunit
MISAKFIFNFDSENEAKIVLGSLSPEIKNKIPKTDAELVIDKNTLFLDISSEDISSLRAAINSYLRWMNTAISVKKKL